MSIAIEQYAVEKMGVPEGWQWVSARHGDTHDPEVPPGMIRLVERERAEATA